jgi:caffeoyl-CoA O-methyltransferase
MEFIDPKLDDYAGLHTSPEKRFIKRPKPPNASKNIATSYVVRDTFKGGLLSMFSHMIQPKCILEIGTYTGYSAFVHGRGLT